MKFWVGVTDKDWYDFLSAREPDEVNFWQPSAKPLTHALVPGTPFLFKLHSPHNYVVGGGFFVRFTVLPVSVAWAAFGERNGAAAQPQLLARLRRLARAAVTPRATIGCNILTEPFFLDEADWIPIPENWAANIVRGKTYDTEEAYGSALWAQVEEWLVTMQARNAAWEAEEFPLYGADYLARARLGQGAFRILVTDAYGRRCAITQERTLPALEAAHIKTYSESGPNRVCNGLLLRSDIHRLFDVGYVTVTSDLKVEVSKQIKEEFENGREYYRYHGARLANPPDATGDRPSRAFIQWHNENVYIG